MGKMRKLLSLVVLVVLLYAGFQYPASKEAAPQDIASTAEISGAKEEAAPQDTAPAAKISAPGEEEGDRKASLSVVDSAPESIPEYAGEDVIILNDNVPNFTEYDLEQIQGQNFSGLDELGRCGTACAMLDETMMPTEKRGDIHMIRPTGWHSVTYPEVTSEDQHLYNRSHLLAYSLTGQNDNERNLITGTQHLNQEVMLPYENEVVRYLEDYGGRVLYRVSPYFKDDELAARGVEMEAYSVEDNGEGVEYHIFIYNVQPGIDIDYATGESRESEEDSEEWDAAA